MNPGARSNGRPRGVGMLGIRCVAVVLGGVLLGRGAPALAQDTPPKLPTAEKVLDKTIEAQGGKEAFEKIKSRVTKGTIEVTAGPQSLKGTIERYEAAPDLRYSEVKLGPTTTRTGSDGYVHWEINQSGAKILEGDEKEAAIRRARFNALLYWRDLYDKVECVGKEKIDDHLCVKVVLTPRVGTPITAYYDWKNGLPLGTDEVRKQGDGELRYEERYDDFRKVDGVMLPFKIKRIVSGGGQTQTIVYTFQTIEHNAVPPERFDLPEEIKKLQGSSGGTP